MTSRTRFLRLKTSLAVLCISTSVFAQGPPTAAAPGGKSPTAGKCPVGAVKVKTVAVTFTLGTTNFDASGVTETWYDFAGGMPTAPLAS